MTNLGRQTVSFELDAKVKPIRDYYAEFGQKPGRAAEHLQALQAALLATPKALAAWLDLQSFYAVAHFFAKDLHEDDYASRYAAELAILRRLLPKLPPPARAFFGRKLEKRSWCQTDDYCAIALSFQVEVRKSAPARPPWVEAINEDYEPPPEDDDALAIDEAKAGRKKASKAAGAKAGGKKASKTAGAKAGRKKAPQKKATGAKGR